ncbi:glycosyltransferase family 2 protein [Planctomonas psychrotolerans]|uniref:glycosyltransferase family 2 protein n=1 Tax=Planctomonas psychrotolerans TaxID=2528712 RepID=UPI001D0CF5D5
MPILNEVDHVESAVQSMLGQDYPGVVQIVLAVGPSTDGTTELVTELSRRDARITSVPNPTGSTPGGLNAAIRASVQPIVIRVDAHSVLPPDYTRIAVETLERTGADNVGGLMNAVGRTPFEKAVARAYGARVGLGGTAHHVGGKEGPAETAYLGAFQRHRLLEVGLFDENIRRGQDWELNRRLRATGGTVWFTPRMKVTYRPRSGIRPLVTQFFATGLWRGDLARRFTRSNSVRYFVPPAMVLAVLVGLLLGFLGVVGIATGSALGWLTLAFLIPAVYVLFVLLSTILVASKDGFASMLRFLIVLPCIHFSWGIGFLFGFSRLTGDLTGHTGR